MEVDAVLTDIMGRITHAQSAHELIVLVGKITDYIIATIGGIESSLPPEQCPSIKDIRLVCDILYTIVTTRITSYTHVERASTRVNQCAAWLRNNTDGIPHIYRNIEPAITNASTALAIIALWIANI